MRSFGVALVAALALVVAAGTASAGKPATNTVIQWYGPNDTSAPGRDGCRDNLSTVPAGTFQVRFGWSTYSTQYTQDFLAVQYVTRTAGGGAPTVEPTGSTANWKQVTGKNGAGEKIYVAQYTSPILATLAAGESITVTFSLKTTEISYDNAETPYPADAELLGDGHTSCTITAA